MDWNGQDLLLAVACFTAMLVFFAPAFVFWWVQSFIRYAPYSYLFTVISSGLWAIYGVDWNLLPLCCLSVFGTIVGMIYVLLFLWFSDPDDPRLQYLLGWTVGGAVFLVGAVAFDLLVPGSTAYGVICCVASCATSAAPFYNLPRVRRERSMDSMPSIFIPAVGLLNAILWTVRNVTVGDVKKIDYNLVVASGVAAVSALLQLILHGKYRRQQPPAPTDLERTLLDKDTGAQEEIDSTIYVPPPPPPPPLPPTPPSGFDKPLIELDASVTVTHTPPLPPTLEAEPLIDTEDTATVQVTQTHTPPPPPTLEAEPLIDTEDTATVQVTQTHTPPPPPTLEAETLVDRKDTATVQVTHTLPAEQLAAPADAVA